MTELPVWLSVLRHDAPLIVSMPHTGVDIPAAFEPRFVSLWLARKDADWWIERLYDFACALGATTIRTSVSRSIIDVNRDPSGRTLYPGQNTTELCPTTTFDGEPLYRAAGGPETEDIAIRRAQFFEPYHDTLNYQIARLRKQHSKVVLFEAHSIRSLIPRLFEGTLAHFNLGTNSGASCAPELTNAIERAIDGDDAQGASSAGGRGNSSLTRATNARFKGGYTTRHYGDPAHGVHAIQLELAMRGYMEEPETPSPENWPPPYDSGRAGPIRAILQRLLETCLSFASNP